MSTPSENILVWMDLEMTGLDPEKERIIEIATLITDERLHLIAEGPTIVIHQSDELLEAMDDWNQEHHGKSGLIDKVKQSTVSESAAEEQTLAFIKKYTSERTAPLCGNSIWQDRRFIARYMPQLDNYLHYRNVDVSSIKELVRRWYPDLEPFKKKKTHTALSDIKESIEELKYYRKKVFVM